MERFNLERERNKDKKLIKKAVEKIKRLIIEENFKIRPIEDKISRIVFALQQEVNWKIDTNQILKKVIEEVAIEQGGFPNKELENRYYKIIAEEITNKIATGEDFYKTIGAVVVDLRKKGIYLDGKKLEEEVRKRL